MYVGSVGPYKVTIAKAGKAQSHVRSLLVKKGQNPRSCQHIQGPAAQAVQIFRAEQWLHRQVDQAHEVHKVLNKRDQRMTGCFRTTPTVLLMNDTGLRSAVPHLDD